MMSWLVKRLQGQVRLQVESPFPERILNLCGAHDLSFWDLEWKSPESFTCRMSRRDYHCLRQAVERMECTLTVLRREGAPYFLGGFRHRTALVLGAVVCGTALFLSSFFVWDFQVEGNETVPTERILRALKEYGVGVGSFGLSLDGEDIRNHLLLELPELSWITVNVSGCRAYVQVRERTPAPELVNKRAPANVVARQAGVVLKIQTLSGVPCVLRGSSVEEGQLLISGVEDTETFGARLTSAMGSVEARTWYTLTTQVPLTVQEKQYTGQKRTLLSLNFGEKRVKFYTNSSIEEENYDKIIHRQQLRLFGLTLPLTVETQQLAVYETVQTTRDAQAAGDAAGAMLQDYLEELVAPYGTVCSTLISTQQNGDVLTVTLRAECQEEIGQQVPIYTDTNDTTTAEDPSA